MADFIHLHNHTHYSLLDAACTVDSLVNAAVEDGHKALALTDHGVMFGCLEFYDKAKKRGIKPILGFEAYVANGSRLDKTAGKKESKKKNYFHLLLLAKNLQGYKNLIKLTTLAHTEGYYYKPRIDEELLEKYHDGIIACSGCINGVVNAHLVAGDFKLAYDKAKYYQQLFGDDFYLELQHHNLAEDEVIIKEVPIIARELNIKLVASNDVHYIKKDHAIAHNVYLFIKDATASNSGQLDIRQLRYRTPEMYFKSSEEMMEIFKDFPDAISNTVEIAEKCELDFDKKNFMPAFPIPEEDSNLSPDDYLRKLTYEGLKQRFKEITPEIQERVDYELGVIKKMQFPGYFLIVQDFIKAAKNKGIRVGPGRGSAAGSLVAYALGITNIDPLKYNLLFERFLNPDRISMPDIDIDFCDVKRDQIIEYVKEKYGQSSVAQIITFGQLSSRLVLKDVGRVLGVHHSEINKITSKIPVVLGKVTPLESALELPDLQDLKNTTDRKLQELIEYSKLLEGLYRNTSTHAAGIVITPGDVVDFVPLYKPSSQKGNGNEVATQYSMKDLEKAGLLKMDFLGLRTLSVIDRTLELIKKDFGVDIDIDNLDLDDEATYDLFSRGETKGVFQFESTGMQEYLRQLKPRNIEEIAAMNALYRPGPMKNIPEYIERKFGRKKIEYLHPVMEKSLKSTYGIIVYQEQVMQISVDFAGFTLAQADNLRKAMGKKDHNAMEKMKPLFIEGAIAKGHDRKSAEELFELFRKFADYGFNKAHSIAYSVLAFQTAWLKAHYPAQFLAAYMSSELANLDKIVIFMEEAKNLGIPVLPPDVNRSEATFTTYNNTILFGLAAIKNVGVNAVESIIEARKEKPFTSFFDFVARVDTKLINKRTLESLVCAGAFDSLMKNCRASFYAAIESALEFGRAVQEKKSVNMESLFAGGGDEPQISEPKLNIIPEWEQKKILEKEKEFLNFYISGNPLYQYQPLINSLSTLSLSDFETNLNGEMVRVCGLITNIRTGIDKNQKPIAFVKLEDITGSAECIFWSDNYQKYRDLLIQDSLIVVIGKLEVDNKTMKIVANEVMTPEEAVRRYTKSISINIFADKFDENNLYKFQSICNDNYSSVKIIFNTYYDSTMSRYSVYEAENINLPINENSISIMTSIFGRNNIRLESK
jgi:DNA polymerase-3 subunit alpha